MGHFVPFVLFVVKMMRAEVSSTRREEIKEGI
jgi:hypothetical protein